ncbi:MAG: hypothetical protein MPK62_11895 [Alphaproteobacteria bacterium]|nr:hypothetical protein [Alphaproteobacteria bacterium]MDA8031802.1 hypothetical protein [Alphaproteobacteria bacterium]
METRKAPMPQEEKVTRIIDCFTRNIDFLRAAPAGISWRGSLEPTS